MTDAVRVGVTEIDATVRSPVGTAELRLLVDSGAMYSLLPENVWSKLGLQPKRRERFALADGTPIERDMGECVIAIPDLGETTTPVILGKPGDVALLGVVTLEELGLVLNPLTRTLHKAQLRLMRIA